LDIDSAAEVEPIQEVERDPNMTIGQPLEEEWDGCGDPQDQSPPKTHVGRVFEKMPVPITHGDFMFEGVGSTRLNPRKTSMGERTLA
jgi:hypothetical protein